MKKQNFDLTNRLILGTAQLGFDYGINNQRGQVPKHEAFEILELAFGLGLKMLDTSSMYGQSEELLGEFQATYGTQFQVVSKMVGSAKAEIRRTLMATLAKLRTDSLHGYLVHNFQHYLNKPEIWQALQELKAEGKIDKIGFSIYLPKELEFLFQHDVQFDLVQVPYSIFDHRFVPYLLELKKRGITIYARSAFLQGIVFKKADDLNGILGELKDKVAAINILSAEEGIPIVSLCLNFCLANEYIDKVVIGVDSIGNFQEIIQSLGDFVKLRSKINELGGFAEQNIEAIYQYLIDVYQAKHSLLSGGVS